LLASLIQTYWALCLFKRGPQDTPYSKVFLFSAVLLFLALFVFQLLLVDIKQLISYSFAIRRAITLTISLFLYTYLLLVLVKYKNRYVQTLTSILMSQVILQFIALPLVLLGPYLIGTGTQQAVVSLVTIFYFLTVVFLNVWQFLINAHIFKHALGTTFMGGLLTGFGLLAFNFLAFKYF